MFTATPSTRQNNIASSAKENEVHGIIETRLWLEEHDWLYRLLRSEDNVSPTFRLPDLISACISLVFEHHDSPARIFRFLETELVLRQPQTPRRRESMWRPQYRLPLSFLQNCRTNDAAPHQSRIWRDLLIAATAKRPQSYAVITFSTNQGEAIAASSNACCRLLGSRPPSIPACSRSAFCACRI